MANRQHVDLFINRSLAGASESYKLHSNAVGVFVSGIFDGAELKLRVNPVSDKDDPAFPSEWYDHPDAIFTDLTENEVKFWTNADLAESWIDAFLSNPGDNTALNMRLRPRTVAVV